eukprot:3124-Eustigmatos_ZCMA.PRE.1
MQAEGRRQAIVKAQHPHEGDSRKHYAHSAPPPSPDRRVLVTVNTGTQAHNLCALTSSAHGTHVRAGYPVAGHCSSACDAGAAWP